MRIVGGPLLVVAGFWLWPHAAAGLEVKDIFKLADPSVVSVLASDARGEKNTLGSGVIIAPLEIVTSCHVVEGAADIVVTQGNSIRTATIHFQDAARDLCQLTIAESLPAGKPVSVLVPSREVEVGQSVYVISSPRGMEHNIGHAMVSSLRDMPEGGGRLIQTDAASDPGSSGGGVFDKDARFIGIATLQFRKGDNARYVIPVEWIAELAQRTAAAVPAVSAASTPDRQAIPKEAAGLPRTGDHWKYRLAHQKRHIGTVHITIAGVSGNTVKERITFDEQKGFYAERSVDARFPSMREFKSGVLLPGGYELTELSPYLPAGIEPEVGRKWDSIAGEFFLPSLGKQRLLSTAKVVRRETVRVPAGQFDAWRIETSTDADNASNNKIKCTFWYSPDMKRTVKMNLNVQARYLSAMTDETYELVSFEPGK